MAMTIAEAYVLGSTAAGAVSVSTGGTERAPPVNGQGSVVTLADYADTAFYIITNGSAPGTPITLVFYAVNAAGRYTEIDRVSGTTNSASTEATNGVLPPSGSIPIPPGTAKVTARAFGHTVAAVGVEAWVGRQVP